ncbi:MAG: sulfotransferase [Alphaproteobacteria bacterium]|nr:sulfotransferase [Alphaproteobacteria bacterium]
MAEQRRNPQTPDRHQSPAVTDGEPRELRYPDFLCIGAQKAGTTWLDRNLRRHPRLWFPPIKELHYFNELYVPSSRSWTARYRRDKGAAAFQRYLKRVPDEEARDYRQLARMADIVTGPISDDWYGRIFALAGEERIAGEITPDYSLLPDAGIEHVLRLAPNVRIILSLRDPIERSWSHIRMSALGYGEKGPEMIPQLASNPDVLARSNYPAMIARWRRYVPEDRFLVVFMDDITAEPHAVLQTLCRFLKVPFNEKRFRKAAAAVHVGEAKPIPAPVLATLKDRLKPVYEELGGLYPEIAERWAARHY